MGHRTASGLPTATSCRELRQDVPHLPFYVVVPSLATAVAVRRSFALAGADRIWPLTTSENEAAFAQGCSGRIRIPVPEDALRLVGSSGIAEPCKTMVSWILRSAVEVHGVEAAAAHFSMSSRQLSRELADEGLPTYNFLRRTGALLAVRELRLQAGLSIRRACELIRFSGVVRAVDLELALVSISSLCGSIKPRLAAEDCA